MLKVKFSHSKYKPPQERRERVKDEDKNFPKGEWYYIAHGEFARRGELVDFNKSTKKVSKAVRGLMFKPAKELLPWEKRLKQKLRRERRMNAAKKEKARQVKKEAEKERIVEKISA